MYKLRPITTAAFVSIAVLLLVGVHSVPVLADSPPACTDDSTTSQPDDSSTTTSSQQTPSPSSSENDSDSSNTTTDSTTPPTDPSTSSSSDNSSDTSGGDPTTPQTDSAADDSTTIPTDPTTTTTDPSDVTNSTDSTADPDSACNDLTLNNQTDSTSQSGDTTVADNGTAGSATSGDAQAVANLINAINSSSDLGSGNLTTFETNVNGDVNGDLVIDPSVLSQAITSDPSLLNDLQFESTNNGTINNTVNLSSTSGDATVSGNDSAGNATTGSADSVADIMNLINSMIASGQSFLGVINIYGDFTGNILVPYQLVNSLLAENSPATTSQTPTLQTDTGTVVNNNESVNNQITTTATSGDATVSNNNSAGNATTGTADTQVNIYNLTGSQVVGSNALLVFINVLGTWLGLIMNAPVGTTSATLGGGITQDSTIPQVTDASVTNNNTETINNNIDVSATSGNALVTDNGTAGNATSGNATASVNLVNILGSEFSLTNWFGILFINVFGTWDGNFGITTPPISDSSSPVTSSTTPGSNNITLASAVVLRPIRVFLPKVSSSSVSTSQNSQSNSPKGKVLGLLTSSPDNNNPTAASTVANVTQTHYNVLIAVIGIVVGAALLITERILTVRRNRGVSTL